LIFLIDVGSEPTPWFPGGLVAELEELWGEPVQVVTERGSTASCVTGVLQEQSL